jgi:hypothetical protein
MFGDRCRKSSYDGLVCLLTEVPVAAGRQDTCNILSAKEFPMDRAVENDNRTAHLVISYSGNSPLRGEYLLILVDDDGTLADGSPKAEELIYRSPWNRLKGNGPLYFFYWLIQTECRSSGGVGGVLGGQ